MKNKNSSTILYIVVFIFVFIMFATTSYAYYVKVVKKDEQTVEKKSFTMLVEYDGPSQIDVHNLTAGYKEEKVFTIKNYSKDTIGTYNLKFNIITPLSQIVDEGFTYVLEGESDSKDTTNKVINVPSTPVPVLSKDIGTGTITPGCTHTYKLTITLNNNKYANNSLFSAGINVTD